MATTGDVLDQHLKCFGQNDLDGVVADYSPDAVLFVPDRPLKEPDAIKPFFQAFFAQFAKPGASFSIRLRYVEGELRLHIVERGISRQFVRSCHRHVRCAGREDRGQSFAAKITPKR
jgi:ketosteroid isomerase-like protein